MWSTSLESCVQPGAAQMGYSNNTRLRNMSQRFEW
jgi:hypothetical protein